MRRFCSWIGIVASGAQRLSSTVACTPFHSPILGATEVPNVGIEVIKTLFKGQYKSRCHLRISIDLTRSDRQGPDMLPNWHVGPERRAGASQDAPERLAKGPCLDSYFPCALY
jgi:hypothetical protein